MRIIKKFGRKYSLYGFYILLFSLLQVTLIGRVLPQGAMPDFGLVLVVICGYMFGRDDGMAIGLLTGFLRDIFAGRVLGLGMLIFMFIGLIASALFINLFQKSSLLVLAQVVLMSIFYEIILIVLTFLFPMLPDQIYDFGQLIRNSVALLPIRLLSNLAVTLPMLLMLRYLGPYPRSSLKRQSSEDESGEHVWRMT